MTTLLTPLAPVTAPATPQLREPALFYAPPYETPVDDEFAWHLVKVLDADGGLLSQVAFETEAGTVWVDFVVETTLSDGQPRRIGFELTRADEDEAQAAMRDALLVRNHALDALYRFRATDVLVRVADVLLVVAGWEPSLFSLRGRTNLERLASPEALLTLVHPGQSGVMLEYAAPSADASDDFSDAPVQPEPLRLDRRSAVHPHTWEVDYARAAELFGLAVRRAA